LKEKVFEYKGIRDAARDCERWKVLCTPSAPNGRRGKNE